MSERIELAAFCEPCEIVFAARERDLVLDELYCPYCSCRTDPADRGDSVEEVRRRFPNARLYTLPRLPTLLELAVRAIAR